MASPQGTVLGLQSVFVSSPRNASHSPGAEIERSDPPKLPARRPSTYMVRVGTFMLAATCEAGPISELLEVIEQGLRDDPRVATIKFPAQDQHWINNEIRYPGGEETGVDVLLSGSDHFHNIVLTNPVEFIVQVPKKNQPDFRGYTDHPSDTYYVAWDGLTVVVGWSVGGTAESVPMAGGQIVADVLQDSLEKANLKLYVQSCSAGCTKLFWHTTVILREREEVEDHKFVDSPAPHGAVVMEAPIYRNALSAMAMLLMVIRAEARHFAGFKNYSRRLINLDQASKSMVDSLLEIQYRKTHRQSLPIRDRVREWWRHRSDTRAMKRLVSSLWLSASRHEALLGEWHEDHDEFRDTIRENDSAVLFSRDLVRDERAVERQDLAFITRAVAETSSRFDARLIALVTIVGGLAALAGALLGAALA